MKPEHKNLKKNNKRTLRTVDKSKTNQIRSMRPWYLFVFLSSFLLYANTIGHKYVLDDNGVIENNRIVKQGITGIPMIFKTPYRYGVNMLDDNLYRPLSLTMFAVEWQVAPNKPILGHLINVLFYALTCVLLLIVLTRLFHLNNPIFPFFACLLWMVHPVHTEVVANIKSRDEIMSVFFLLLSVYLLISFFNKKSLLTLTGSLFAYFFALLSKEGVITFLLIMPVIGWYLHDKFRLSDLKIALLFLIPAVTYILIRQAVLNAWATPGTNTLLDNLLIAAPNMQTRLATAVFLLGKYLFLLIAPLHLVSDYSYNQVPITDWSDPLVIISLLTYVAALFFAIKKLKEKSFLVFGIILFLITMSIYSNIVLLIGSSFAERFLYLPSIGFCIVISAAIMLVFRVNGDKQAGLELSVIFKKFKGPTILLAVIMLLFSIQTISRNHDWKDEFTLFSKDVSQSPNSAHMRLYWGTAMRDKALEEKDPLLKKEWMEKALSQFNQAVVIYPSYPDAWSQMGLAYSRLGDRDHSLESYQKALTLNPMEATTYVNMGFLFFQKGDYQKAIELYQRAIQLDPNYADAYFNLGSSLGTIGKFKSAAENFLKCLELNPANARACYFLGITYRSLNDSSESKRYLEMAVKLDSTMGH